MQAVEAKCYDNMVYLLEKGADVNKQNKLGETALMYAIHNNHVDSALLLLNKGADVNKQNELGETALMLAIANNDKILMIKLILLGATLPESSNELFTILKQNQRYNDILAFFKKMINFTNESKTNKNLLQLQIKINAITNILVPRLQKEEELN